MQYVRACPGDRDRVLHDRSGAGFFYDRSDAIPRTGELGKRISERGVPDIIDDDIYWYLIELWKRYDAVKAAYADDEHVNMSWVCQSVRTQFNKQILCLGDEQDAPRPLEHLRAKTPPKRADAGDRRVKIIFTMLDRPDSFRSLGLTYHDLLDMTTHELDELIASIEEYDALLAEAQARAKEEAETTN